MLLESSIMLLENIDSTSVNRDNHHIFIVQATGLYDQEYSGFESSFKKIS